MALPREYTGQNCSAARALEVVGERWTLLIVRDALYGVRRFTDFQAHLDIPRAVLADRLGALVESGVLERVRGATGRGHDYVLTDKGIELWPIVRSLSMWGEQFYPSDKGVHRFYTHTGCDAELDVNGRCTKCGQSVPAADVTVVPGPALRGQNARTDPVSRALAAPHRLLEPLTIG